MRQFAGLLILVALIVGIGAAIASNQATQPTVQGGIPGVSVTEPTQDPSNAVADTSNDSSVDTAPILPVIPSGGQQPTPEVPVIDGPTPRSLFALDIDNSQSAETADANNGNGGIPSGWNPPPQEVPIARHPNDHYWFVRPVGPSDNNFGLVYYPYGSNGPNNDLRVHHGIDLSNPIGVQIFAGGSGTVIMAGKGFTNEFETITSYGETVVVEHDFGYQGQKLYTLYAHMSAVLVQKGDHVEAGDVVGLIGNTGQVTGPHVHFEVRVGVNRYATVRNPNLWIAPYVGTGVIAGRAADENDEFVYDAPVSILDPDSGELIYETTTYAAPSVSSDEKWRENFVVPDVPAGNYLITIRGPGLVWAGTVDVLPGMTNWVHLERSEVSIVIPDVAPPSDSSTPTPIPASPAPDE